MSVPTDYKLISCAPNYEDGCFELEWEWAGDLKKCIYKVFDEQNGTNKFTFDANKSMDGGEFKNGIPIDLAVNASSTESRREGDEARMGTLETMMYMARMQPYGYNFAELEDAFPNNPDIKERLEHEEISISDWKDIIDTDPDFMFINNDAELNAFLRYSTKRCLLFGINPSHFLASRFDKYASNVWFEFRTIMNTNKSFQNGMLRFFNSMMPTFCPSSIDDAGIAYLFTPSQDKSDKYCMKLEVPYTNPETGETFYWREKVYASYAYFGYEFSGFHRPNINGASQMMDQLNALAVAGKISSEEDFRNVLRWATSDRAFPGGSSITLDTEAMLQDDWSSDGED